VVRATQTESYLFFFRSLVNLFCLSAVLEPPGAPRNLHVSDITTTSISIGWEPPVSDGSNDVMQYDIDMREESDADYSSVAKVSNRITSYTVEKLHRGRLYRFRVRSKNAAGYSESAAELDAPVQLKALGMHTIICVMMTLLKYYCLHFQFFVFLLIFVICRARHYTVR